PLSYDRVHHLILHRCNLTLPFASSGAHRDVTSFPTRRSSDLRCDESRRGLSIAPRPKVRRGGVCVLAALRSSPGNASRPARTQTDRKSTRLNSSHQIISYAVFCLKKKLINTLQLNCENGRDES